MINEIKDICSYTIDGLQPSSVYYVMVTAFNQKGEGYKPGQPSIVQTKSEIADNLSEIYVWGSNTYSEIGLTEELVALNKSSYVKNEIDAHLTKPVFLPDFGKMVSCVSCSSMGSVVVCVDGDE